MKQETFPSKEKNHPSLEMILNNVNEIIFSYPSGNKTFFHKHLAVLTWALTTVIPEKIAVFDNDPYQITQQTLYEISQSLELDCLCYSDPPYNNTNILNDFTLPIRSSELSFDLIYINNINQSLKNIPYFPSIHKSPPENTIFILDNLYGNHSIANENRPTLMDWKNRFPFFEFTHHNGLVIFYTGQSAPTKLQELFTLKQTPILAQRFKKRCAFADEYWAMYNHIRNDKKSFNQDDFLEARIQQILTERKSRYLEQKIENLQKTIDELHQNQTIKNDRKTIAPLLHIQEQKIREKLFRVKKMVRKRIPNLFNGKNESTHASSTVTMPVNITNTVNSTSNKTFKLSHSSHRILFVAGEPHTPGVIYRCYRNANACIMAGHQAQVINAAMVSPADIQWADILILWRVEYSGHINGILKLSKEYHTLTAFDADDIVFKPSLAQIELIDGIRSIGSTEAETARTFSNMRETLIRTDFAVATTKEMREHMAHELIPKHAGPLIFTLPNIFDDSCVKLSRFVARIKKCTPADSYIRVGYALGTRTHQKDFAVILPALISVFQKRLNVRLVLFKESQNHRPILHMDEFPELADYSDRIEWRDMVPLEQLPQELARFDISIAPLEADNIFCNAKSELKYFEAALANVCTIASPTGPMKRCIDNGITGFLAYTAQEWESCLLQLIDNDSLRKKMAQNAYHAILWNFSIQRQSKLFNTMLQSLTNEREAALAAETTIARKAYKNRQLPMVPPSDILFEHDALQEADVTVIITSYNYSQYLLEALESVRAQTLPIIDLIVVDDGSSDSSIDLLIKWTTRHKDRFNRLQIHKSVKNVGLGGARNIGIAASETLYSMQLDADNRLMPDTCEKLLKAIQGTNIGYAYPHIQHFGAGEAIGGHVPFNPLRLSVGNYIDAMVMLAKWAWAAVGGFYVQRDAMGWEDYDLWCNLAEMGIAGTQVSEAIAEYRAHFSSMTNVVTEQNHHKPKVVSYLESRHPWLDIVYPERSPWIKNEKN